MKVPVLAYLGSQRKAGGNLSSQSWQYIINAVPICLRLDRQAVFLAFSLARLKTGKRIAARIAMIAMTTNNSINVNPFLFSNILYLLLFVLFFAPIRGRVKPGA
jgi:hypothetical protein